MFVFFVYYVHNNIYQGVRYIPIYIYIYIYIYIREDYFKYLFKYTLIAMLYVDYAVCRLLIDDCRLVAS